MGGSLRSILPVSDGRWPQAIGVHGFGLCCDPVGRFRAHRGPGGSIMSEVPRTKTPLSPSALAAAIDSEIKAYPTLVPARDYIVALARVETGNGASLIANNFGNLSAGGFSKGVEKLYSGDYWRPPWFADSTNALHKKMLDGQAPSAFRAYGSASAGVRAYLGLLASAQVRDDGRISAVNFAGERWQMAASDWRSRLRALLRSGWKVSGPSRARR